MKSNLNKPLVKRKDDELPPAVIKGMRYHHIGIPTKEKRSGEIYLTDYKMYVSGFETSEYGIEWMRFDDDSPVADIIQRIPHIAFEVDNLTDAVKDRVLLDDISSPSKGVRVAMVLEDGAPVEFLEFDKTRE